MKGLFCVERQNWRFMVTVSSMMEAMQKWRWICSPSAYTAELRRYSTNERSYLQTDLELPEFWGSLGIPGIMAEVSESEFPPPTEPLRQFSISEPQFVWCKMEMTLCIWKAEPERTKKNTAQPALEWHVHMNVGVLLNTPAPIWHVPSPQAVCWQIIISVVVRVTILHSQTVLRGLLR